MAAQEFQKPQNALEPSNALNYRIWGIVAVLSRGIPGKALRALPGSFRNCSGISSGKSQPYCGGMAHFCSDPNTRKNPHAHKNKIGTSTPPPSKKTQTPPPQKEEFYGHGGFPSRKNQKMPGAHKIGAAISGPELRTEILWTSRFF